MKKYAPLGILFALVSVIILGGTSCGRKITTHSRDTIYIKKVDTIQIKPDTVAILKVEKSIDSVFVEIEKDCPNLPKKKLVKLKEVIEGKCTHESLSGGTMRAKSARTNVDLIIRFNGNDATVYFDVEQPEITDKTVITKSPSLFRQALNVWFLWLPFWIFIAIWAFFRFFYK